MPVELDWTTLLDDIQQKRVIPVIGGDLLVTSRQPGAPSIYQGVAAELAKSHGIPVTPQTSLRDVVFQCLRGNKVSVQDLRVEIRTLIDAIVEPPEPLRKLAKIDGLQLFVTTTIDRLMEKALRIERGDDIDPISIDYFPETRPADIPDLQRTPRPCVYHLLGSTRGHFAVDEADMIEQLQGLASEKRQPALLFDELRSRSMLFLGCGFPDWLARFFIRILKTTPFMPERRRAQIVADERIAREPQLADFLDHHALSVYRAGDGPAFVDELLRRWEQLTPPRPEPGLRNRGEVFVFLSFWGEDRDVARAVRDALDAKGIDVFFDERNLKRGDNLDLEISTNLHRCSLFIPLVSKHTEADLQREAYFWKEWNAADERAAGFGPRGRFILPVMIDPVDVKTANVPERFRIPLWHKLPERTPTEAFCEAIRDEVRAKQREGGP